MMNQKIIPFPGMCVDNPVPSSTEKVTGTEPAEIIQFPESQKTNAAIEDGNQPDDDGMVGEYFDLMKDISCQLQQISELFEISPKEVMIDLTYIFVSNDILRSFEEDEDNEESDDDNGND